MVSAKLSMDGKVMLDEQEVETYKYFLEWDSANSEDLLLEKNGDTSSVPNQIRAKRQS